MLEKLSHLLSRVNAPWADLRYESVDETRFVHWKGETRGVESALTDGYVLRVLKNGGLATVTFSRLEDFDRALKSALESAEILGSRTRTPAVLAAAPVVRDSVTPQFMGRDPRSVSLDEKLALVRAYHDAAKAHEAIAAVNLTYREFTRSRYYLNTEGTQVSEDLVFNSITGEITASQGSGSNQSVRVGFGGTQGFHVLENRMADLETRKGFAIDLLSAESAPSGSFPVILDNSMTGLFTHEAFGHFSEADLIEDNASLRSRMQLGAELGSSAVSITADSTRERQLGHYKYDDEGVAPQRVSLMENGILKGRLHSRRTAAAFGEPLTGHAIAEDYRYGPIIRMGTIFIEPNPQLSLDGLMAEMGDGLYICGAKGGQTSGEQFTFGSQYGFRVKNGKKAGLFRSSNISGNLFTTLKAIASTASDLQLGEVGGCGKGQLNPRSNYGGPHIHIRELVVGGM